MDIDGSKAKKSQRGRSRGVRKAFFFGLWIVFVPFLVSPLQAEPLPSPATAADPWSDDSSLLGLSAEPPPRLSHYGFRMLSLLSVLALAAWIATHYLKKNASKVPFLMSGAPIVFRTSLGPKKSICGIKLAGKILVVGVTDHNVRLLTEMSEAEWNQSIPSASPPSSPSGGDRFQDKLKKLMALS